MFRIWLFLSFHWNRWSFIVTRALSKYSVAPLPSQMASGAMFRYLTSPRLRMHAITLALAMVSYQRGISQRAPYFHDGRAATLTDVLRSSHHDAERPLAEEQIERLLLLLESL